MFKFIKPTIMIIVRKLNYVSVITFFIEIIARHDTPSGLLTLIFLALYDKNGMFEYKKNQVNTHFTAGRDRYFLPLNDTLNFKM